MNIDNTSSIEEGDTKGKSRYNKWILIAGIFLAPVVLFGTSHIISRMLNMFGGITIEVAAIFSMLGFLIAATLYTAIIGELKNFRSFLRLKNFEWRHVTTGLFSAVTLYIIVTAISILAAIIGESNGTEIGSNSTSDNLASLSIASYLLISILIVGFLTPIAEELFFRGALLGSLVQQSKSKLLRISSVFAVGIFFSLMHFQAPTGTVSDWTAVIIPGLVGLAAGFLTLIYDSLYPAIFTHLFYNGIVVTFIGFSTFG